MSLKLLRSTLCLLSVGALFVDEAIAQSDGAAAKAKFASDYNTGKWRDVIADADMLKKAGALDDQAQLIVAQAYFKAGDLAGCAKTILENPVLSKDDVAIDGDHPAAELLERCRPWPEP